MPMQSGHGFCYSELRKNKKQADNLKMRPLLRPKTKNANTKLQNRDRFCDLQ